MDEVLVRQIANEIITEKILTNGYFWLLVALLWFVSIAITAFLVPYFQTRGKNLATKVDIESITGKVEQIRALHLKDIELLKANLDVEAEVLDKRRRIYEEIAVILRIFLAGHSAESEEKNRFLNAYATAWLWASDAVLSALNHFLALQINHAAKPNSVQQEEMKSAYTAVVLEMRKDSGFPNSSSSKNDYKFMHF